MAAIQVEGQELSRGVFDFVPEILQDDALIQPLFDMEKVFFSNQMLFLGNMRKAFEAIVASEYLRMFPEDRQLIQENDSRLDQIMTQRMQGITYDHPYRGNFSSGLKLFLILRCCDPVNILNFKTALEEYHGAKNYYTVYDIRTMISGLYAFCSEESIHNNYSPINKYRATRENCEKYLKVFYYFLRGYCKSNYPDRRENWNLNLNKMLMPINDYIYVPGSKRAALKMKGVKEMYYYIKESAGTVSYYLICDIYRKDQDREIDVLRQIWAEDSDSNPDNIIRFREEIVPCNGWGEQEYDRSKLVFALPSKPMALSKSNLSEIYVEDKERLFRDAQRAIASLHGSIPVLYHRDITPEAFTLGKTKSSYKLFLSAFDCVKDTDTNAPYTKKLQVLENAKNPKKRPFMAPEILEIADDPSKWEQINDLINWEQADIYALGMLGVFIFTGETDIEALERVDGINEATRSKILAMCGPAGHRPTFS